MDAGGRSFNRRVCQLAPSDNLYIVNAEYWDKSKFERLLADHPGAFVVLDCHTDMYDQPSDTDQAHHMRRYIKYFRDTFAQLGANGIVIDHTKRTQTGSSLRGSDLLYGSTQKKGTWRQVVLVERVRPSAVTPGCARVKLSCVKMSESEEFPPFYIDLKVGDGAFSCEYAGLATAQDARETKTSQLRESIVDVLSSCHPETRSATEIAMALSTPRNSHAFSDALKAVQNAGVVAQVGKGRSTAYQYIGDEESNVIPLTRTAAA
jgi:hypothetical protein